MQNRKAFHKSGCFLCVVVLLLSILTACGSSPGNSENSTLSAEDFFIFSASGANDFAYRAFQPQIMSMAEGSDGFFRLAKTEERGNLSFLEREGYSHDGKASEEYTYNGLRFFWNRVQ